MRNRILATLFLVINSAIFINAQQTPATKAAKPVTKKPNCSVSITWEENYAVKIYFGKKEVDLDAKDTQTTAIAQGSYSLKMETLNKTVFAEEMLILKPGHSYLDIFVSGDTLKFKKETDAQRKQRLNMEAGNQKMAEIKKDSIGKQRMNKRWTDSVENMKIAKERADSTDRIKALQDQLEKAKIGVDKTVTIGAQVWTAVNLNVSTFRNGDAIPEANTPEQWKDAESSGKPAWCYLKYDSVNGRKFGKLYNWYAVNDPRGLTPKGWHIPANDERETMISSLGENNAGKKAKCSSGWDGDGNGDNSSGLTACPVGKCTAGDFVNSGKNCYFWTKTKGNGFFSWAITLSFDNSAITSSLENNSSGFSCRCIKDN